MKNKFKKLLAFAIFAIMTMAMAVTASATTGTYTVTLKGKTVDGKTALTNNTYEVYKIATFDVERLGGNGEVVYTNINVQEPYTAVFKPDEVSSSSAEDRATLASKLAKITNEEKTTVESGVFTTTETGYYLFKEVKHSTDDAFLATKYILVAVDGYDEHGNPEENENVELKTSMAGITKKIVVEDPVLSGVTDAVADSRVDGSVAAIGDTITYEIKAQIPEYPNYAEKLTYVITDVMSGGLTDAGVDTITINEADKKENFTIAQDGQKITITANNDTVLTENPGATIVVTLKATLNGTANVGSNGNPNSVNLKYTNNWDMNTTYETPKDTVITYTGKLVIKKVDSTDDSKVLSGATFAIYGPRADKKGTAPSGVDSTYTKNNKTYYYYESVTTDGNGLAAVSGLDAGTYYAKETAAPQGYSLATDVMEIPLTIDTEQTNCEIENANGAKVSESSKETSFERANNNTVKNYQAVWNVSDSTPKVITNTQGTTLPGTGGMGTTIFTIGGIVLVALAALMFVVYMRKQKKQA